MAVLPQFQGPVQTGVDPRTGFQLGGPVPNFQQFGPQQLQPISPQITARDFANFGVPTAQNLIIPPTGLAGSELALGGGASTAFGAINRGTSQGLDFLNTGIGGVQQAGGQAQSTIGSQLNQSQLATQQAVKALQASREQGLQAINAPIEQAIPGFEPFTQTGVQANDLFAALSGALGNEAQAQAFQNFTASPGQSFLKEQGELSRVNQAAASGGLGGANFQKRIVEFGQGLAQQDLARQLGDLNILGGRGLASQTEVGRLRGTQAGLSSDLIGRLGQAEASTIQTGSEIGSGLAKSQASAVQEAARQALAGRQTQADITGRAGFATAETALGVSRDLSTGRTQAGRDIATAISDATTALSRLSETEGAGVSDITGAGADEISRILQNAGLTQQQSQQALAAILANIASGQASTVANLPGIPGVQQDPGVLGGVGQLAGGIGGLLEGLK